MHWALLDTLTPLPGWHQMALDDALLDLAIEERVVLVRLYRWSPGCLSFGRNEPALERYDRTLIERLGLDTVRRPTGGRAVWHWQELTYAVAAPHQALGGPRAAYREIHRLLADAIAGLGLATSLAPAGRTAPLHSGACFAEPAGGEVLADGRKAVGSAQVRRGAGLLQHGSILLGQDQSQVARVTRGAAPPGMEGPLETLVGRTIDPRELADLIQRTLGQCWGPPLATGNRRDGLERMAADLSDKYRDPAWTWRR